MKKNKQMSFADKAKKIKAKYGKRIDQGDATAIASMEDELNQLFQQQEEIKLEQQRQETLQALEQNPELLDQLGQEMNQPQMGMMEQPEMGMGQQPQIDPMHMEGMPDPMEGEPQMMMYGGKMRKKYNEGGTFTGQVGTKLTKQSSVGNNIYGSVTPDSIEEWKKRMMPFLKAHGLENINVNDPDEVKKFQQLWNNEFSDSRLNYDGKFGDETSSTTVDANYGKTSQSTATDEGAAGGTEAEPYKLNELTDAEKAYLKGREELNAVGPLDAIQYGIGALGPAAQMAYMDKPEDVKRRLDSGLESLPEYYDQDTRNQIRSSGAAARRAIGDSNTQGRTAANLIGSQVAEGKAIGELGQRESAMNYQTDVNRANYNAQVRGANVNRMAQYDQFDEANRAAYEDQMLSLMGNLSNNMMGVTRDIDNRRTVNRIYPNYGVGGRDKGVYGTTDSTTTSGATFANPYGFDGNRGMEFDPVFNPVDFIDDDFNNMLVAKYGGKLRKKPKKY